MTVHTMTDKDRIAYLEAQIAKMKEAKQSNLRLKVSEKGAISIYGLGRFPVTLYKGQMQRLLQIVPEIEQFLVDHAGELREKEAA